MGGTCKVTFYDLNEWVSREPPLQYAWIYQFSVSPLSRKRSNDSRVNRQTGLKREQFSLSCREWRPLRFWVMRTRQSGNGLSAPLMSEVKVRSPSFIVSTSSLFFREISLLLSTIAGSYRRPGDTLSPQGEERTRRTGLKEQVTYFVPATEYH